MRQVSETRKAAWQGGPDRNPNLMEDFQNIESPLARQQVLWLAARFGLTVEFAAAVAQIVYAAGPR